MKLTQEQIDIIAKKVAANLGQKLPSTPAPPASSSESGFNSPFLGDGVFNTIDEAVNAATTAFQKFSEKSLDVRDKIIASIRHDMLENAELLARLAHEETGLGRLDSKIVKNQLVTNKTPELKTSNPLPGAAIMD